MRDHSKHVEVSRDQAIGLLLEHASFQRQVETVPLTQANGRVLAEDALAQLDLPNCLTCNMDSVAVHWSDFENGMPDTTGWQRGREWEFANTGIGMPEGFDTAIVIEHVQLSEDCSRIAFDAAPSQQYAGTSPAGSRMHAGDVLVEAGEVLTPLLISLIASGNNTQVKVIAKPQVVFIPTGSELVPPGSDLPRGKNIETNSLLAQAKVEAWGGICKVWDILPDSPELIKEAVAKAAKEADILVLNAGSSKGSDDWNVEMLEEIGTVLYHQTNHGPGHHSSGAVVDGTVVVGISGPPGGAAFTMDFYLYPLIMEYLGLSPELERMQVRLGQGFPQKKKPAGGGQKMGAKGEARPNIVAEGSEFFGVKQLRFEQREGSDALWVVPASSSHPGQVEAEQMDCYYLLGSLAPVPQEGDIIEVEVRP